MSAAVYRGRATLRSRFAAWLDGKTLGDTFDSRDAMRVATAESGVSFAPTNCVRAKVQRALLRFEAKGRIRRLNRDRVNSREAARWVVAW
jgi:hypothetical protein